MLMVKERWTSRGKNNRLGSPPQAASVAIAEVLDAIGVTCPECPPS
jgi:hypothetical protein